MTELIEFRAAVQQLISSARPRADFTLRPLLYVAGAAAATVGVYYYIKKREDEEKMAEFKNTPLTEDSVQTMSLLDPGWMSDEAIHFDSVIPEESHRSETEESNQKVEVFSPMQNSKCSNLEKRVKELEELLCESRQECERRTRVSLDEAQSKYNEAMQTIRNQERWQHDLESEINEQQETIHDLEEALLQIKTSCSTATAEMERLSRQLTDIDSKWNLLNDTVLKNYGELSEDHLKLFRQYNELKEEHDKLQEVTRVETVAAFERVMVSNNQLEKEKAKLLYHLHKLRSRVQQLEEMLYEADITCAVLKQDRERAEEAYGILTSQYRETFKQRNELLKVSLAEAEKKLGPVMESGAQLSYVNLLRSSLQKWEKELSETHRKCDETMRERKKKWEEHNILKTQYDEIMDILKQCDEFHKVMSATGI